MIKAVIIDDEPTLQDVNKQLLAEYFPEIKVVGIANSVSSAVDTINHNQPDLVLLDIAIKEGTGFEVLQKLRPYTFKVVFITGFDSYAIKAIKYSALDYILKPVNEIEFQQAIKRAVNEIKAKSDTSVQSDILMESFKKETQSKKLVLKTTESLNIVDIADILYCQSDNSYTTFYLTDNEKITVSKSIKEYDELLSEYNFFRTHQSYLVNLNFIKKVDKSDGGFVIMKNKREIPVSIRQKKSLIKRLSNL